MPQAAQQHRVHRIDVGGDDLAVRRFLPGPEADGPRQQHYGQPYPPAAAEERADDGDGSDDDISGGRSISVAAQRNVKVVPEPAAEGHMPATPELLRIHGLIGRIEVLGQIETHQHGHAGSDVRVAGKVCIDLQGIAEKGRQVLEAAVHQGILKHAVCEVDGQVIGQDELFQQAVHNPEDGYSKPASAEVIRLVQLLHKFHGPHDGTGHQLGEKAEIEAEIQEIPHGLYLPSLHIHHIAHGLEGEEGNAYRQDDGVYTENTGPREHVQPLSQHIVHLQRQAEEVVHKVREEVRILEIRQDAQVYHHADGGEGRSAFLPLDAAQPLGGQIVIDDDKYQQSQKNATGLVIEEQ